MSSVSLELPGVRRGVTRSRAPLRPWTDSSIAILLLGNVVALVLIAVGWYQASDKATVNDQLTWMNVGLLGVGVSGLVNGSWLLRGRKVIGLARAEVFAGRPARTSEVKPVLAPAADRLVTAPGMTRYHRPECLLAAGKELRDESRGTVVRAQLLPCETCRPAS